MNRETLFELLDGELDAQQMEQAIGQLLDDPELQKSWHRQHLARAAISEQHLLGQGDMVNRVAAALATEPTVMAPDNLAAVVGTGPERKHGHDKVIPVPNRGKRYLAYAAVAASLMAAVLFSLPQPAPEAPGIADQSTSLPATVAAGQELQAMIVQHGEFSGAAALNGLVAYTKVVTGSTASGNAFQP